MTSVYRFLSLKVWGNIPSSWQRSISKRYAKIYNRSFTKWVIRPYCKFNNLSDEYLNQFVSSTGSNEYASFQDFFTRVYKIRPSINAPSIWPCEGLLCDYGMVKDMHPINVKGDHKNIESIFGELGSSIPKDYFFSNVFLHNNNYHRIHSPTIGRIKSIEHIPGDLVILRPWIYKHDPSLPAMRNERVNIVVTDNDNRDWFLSIVGGPAVGTIDIPENIAINKSVDIGDELGKFLLGSTLCMAAPIATNAVLNDTVYVGQTY